MMSKSDGGEERELAIPAVLRGGVDCSADL
jgi:hypothetical protein